MNRPDGVAALHVLAVLVWMGSNVCLAAGSTTFFVVRHAEKQGEAGDVHLSEAGRRRAQTLAELLRPLRIATIYVTEANRAKETAAPLAEALDLTPTTYDYSDAWADGLAERHAGTAVVIVGHANTVPKIVARLSRAPAESIDDEYDNLFVVSVAGEQRNAVRLRFGARAANAVGALAVDHAEAPPGGTLRSLLVGPHIERVRTLAQNWTDAEAREFYNTAQGSRLFPYRWLLHLEQPGMGQKRFLDPDHVRQLGYLPRHPGPGNPDGLPIGFVKDVKYASGMDSVGLTCAACHTNQVEHNGTAYLIDGAPTLGDVESFLKSLETALDQTLQAPKFERFAAAVLGPAAAPDKREQLRAQMKDVLRERRGYNQRNMAKPGSSPFGHGRVDAFGAILNEVTVNFVGQSGNVRPANAPVSYPFLWDTPHHVKVQWNGAAENDENLLLAPIIGTSQFGALGRNAGEVLGVFGHADLSAEHGLLGGYASTLQVKNLVRLEELVETLWSPQWPEEFGPIDPDKRRLGAILYQQHCVSCHALIDRRDPNRRANEKMTFVGTDNAMARNFATRVADSGVLRGRRLLFNPFEVIEPRAGGKDLLAHVVLRAIVGPELAPESVSALSALADFRYSIQAEVFTEGTVIEGGFRRIELDGDRVTSLVADEVQGTQDGQAFSLAPNPRTNAMELVGPDVRFAPPRLKGFSLSAAPEGAQLRPTAEATLRFQYKARPLNGIWATAPYLHNGSVPTLDELLQPQAKRSARFKVGSRKFDPVRVGFETTDGPFEYDTSLPGNSNAGHEYATGLNPQQRAQLLEFLKSL